MSNRPRPLSPHLQVYKLKFHMVLSGLHRITGMGLLLGLLVLAWWATALATSKAYYGFFETVMLHPLGRLVLFGLTFSFVYHALNGVRHLLWDTGRNLEIAEVNRTGLVVVVLAAVLTVGLWVLAYFQAGGLSL